MPRLVTYVAIITLGIGAWPSRVHAQTSSAASTARQTPATLGFLTNYHFHLNALRLVSNDDNFVWDTDFGGDLDFADLQYFRINLLVNFEAIIGEEIRAIDPNQGTIRSTPRPGGGTLCRTRSSGSPFTMSPVT